MLYRNSVWQDGVWQLSQSCDVLEFKVDVVVDNCYRRWRHLCVTDLTPPPPPPSSSSSSWQIPVLQVAVVEKRKWITWAQLWWRRQHAAIMLVSRWGHLPWRQRSRDTGAGGLKYCDAHPDVRLSVVSAVVRLMIARILFCTVRSHQTITQLSVNSRRPFAIRNTTNATRPTAVMILCFVCPSSTPCDAYLVRDTV